MNIRDSHLNKLKARRQDTYRRIFCATGIAIPAIAVAYLLTTAVSRGTLTSGDALPESAKASSDQERVLQKGQPIEREIAAQESHTYRLELEERDFFIAALEQIGIDVQINIVGPDGEIPIKLDSPTGAWGREPVFLMAEVDGTYKIEVKSLYGDLARGRYRIELLERRRATYQDEQLHLGLQAHLRSVEISATASSIVTAEVLSRAISEQETAIKHWLAAKSKVGVWRAKLNTASLFAALGQFDKGLGLYRETLQTWLEPNGIHDAVDTLMIPWQDDKSYVLLCIGDVYYLLGEYFSALDYYQEALTLSRRTKSVRWQAEALGRVGYAYLALAKPQEALEYLQNALELWRTRNHLQRQVSVLRNMAQAYESLGEVQSALDTYTQALPLSQASQHDRYGASDILADIARNSYLLGHSGQALKYGHQALRAARDLERPYQEQDALLTLGDLYAAMGQTRRARELYSAALAQTKSLERNSGLLALDRLARLARDEGRLDEALAQSQKAVDYVDSQWARVLNPHLKMLLLASQQEFFELHIDVLMQLHAERPNEGFDRQAFELNERTRARRLLIGLPARRSDTSTLVEPSQLAKERRLIRRLEAVGLQQSRRYVAGTTPLPKGSEVTDLITRYQELSTAEGDIVGPSQLRNPPQIRLSEIQQTLGSDTVLLEYALGEERSYVWAVTSQRIASFGLPPRRVIEDLAREVYSLLVARSHEEPFETRPEKLRRIELAERNLPQAASALSSMILGPVAEYLDGRRLAIAADGMLHYIPFAVLSNPTLRTQMQSSGQTASPLILHHEIVGIPSGAVLRALRDNRQKRATRTLVIVADPVFGRKDPRLDPELTPEQRTRPETTDFEITRQVTRSARALGRSEFKRLPATRHEAEVIASFLPESKRLVVSGFDARRDPTLLGYLADSSIVHFATHAVVHDRHPELSHILLSLVDRKGQTVNGLLTLNDVHGLQIKADLVVLSACETAIGKQIRGEGLVSFAYGFLRAGGSAVVASVWSPQDEATAELMKRFYQYLLQSNQTPSEALRAAQISMWQEDRWYSPYYWGAFTLQGDWQALEIEDH